MTKKNKKKIQKHLKSSHISDIINRALCETDAHEYSPR